MLDKEFELEMLRQVEKMTKKPPCHETQSVYVDGLLVAYVTTPTVAKRHDETRE